MCSGSEAGSYLRLIDFVYHSTLGSRVIKKKSSGERERAGGGGAHTCLQCGRIAVGCTLSSEEGSYLRLIDLCITEL